MMQEKKHKTYHFSRFVLCKEVSGARRVPMKAIANLHTKGKLTLHDAHNLH